MAIGKNAKKRAARRAFHESTDMGLDMPYSFKVVQYTDGVRRVLTFASLTSYKNYRKEFFASNPKGKLFSLQDALELEKTKDQEEPFFRGYGTKNIGAKDISANKGKSTIASVKGGRFRPEGFKVTQSDIAESIAKDTERDKAIKAGTVRKYNDKALRDVRLKNANI